MIKKKKGVAGQGQTPPKKPSSGKDTLVRLAGQMFDPRPGRDDETVVGGKVVTDGGQVAAAEVLTKQLQEKVDLIRTLVQRADCQEIELRFEIAEHCRDVKDGDGNTFGDGAVQKLADALGWAPSIIYDYVFVARAWKTKEEAVAVAQVMNRGWRHLVEIASTPAETRQELIVAVRDDGMSLRAIRRHRKRLAPAASRTKPAPSLEDMTPAISLLEALQDFAVDLTQFEKHVGPHADRLADALAKAEPTDITPEFAKGLLEIRNRLEAISAKSIEVIDACLAAGKQAKAAPEAKPVPTKPKAKMTESVAAA